jgi:N-acetylglucosamine malate deacetylase 2
MKRHILAFKLIVLSFLLSLQFQIPAYAQAQQEIKALIVTAHPDDESVFAATIYKITHDLKGKVDIVLVTNGEAGFKYSTLSEDIYGVELTDEKVGREHLPTIRKQEMMNAGKIIGIRNYYFLEQKDHQFTQDVQEVFKGIWDIDNVKKRLNEIMLQGGYDLVFTFLPTADTHGHHKAATILALETVKNLQSQKRPIILGARSSRKDDTAFTFAGLDGFPVTKINKDAPVFVFDRTQSFGFRDNLNYKIIVNWLIAEHKSQGATQMAMVNPGDLEKFWYYEINSPTGIETMNNLFKQLKVITYKKREY